MAVRVELDEGPYLADVGFGGLALTAALRLEPDTVQATRTTGSGCAPGAGAPPANAPQGRVEHPLHLGPVRGDARRLRDRQLVPDDASLGSRFLNELMVARAGDDHRLTLHNHVLRFHGADGTTGVHELSGAEGSCGCSRRVRDRPDGHDRPGSGARAPIGSVNPRLSREPARRPAIGAWAHLVVLRAAVEHKRDRVHVGIRCRTATPGSLVEYDTPVVARTIPSRCVGRPRRAVSRSAAKGLHGRRPGATAYLRALASLRILPSGVGLDPHGFFAAAHTRLIVLA